jgi:predicted Zn-dependent protease
MSTFKPTKFDDDVNVTKQHPLKEVFLLLLSALGFILALYVTLTITFILIIPHISVENENWLWSKIGLGAQEQTAEFSPFAAQEQYLQDLVDSLPSSVKPEGYQFTVHVTKSPDINAYAAPGGNIIVTSRLLQEVDSENALMFVLGHELGHFVNRDHLRSMGQGFAALVVSLFFLGQDSQIVDMLLGLAQTSQLAYSRHQEKQADMWGLKVLMAHYGHAGGAGTFFETLAQGDTAFIKTPALLSTHPDTLKRIEYLKDVIADMNFPVEETIPLALPAKEKEPRP